MPPRQSQDHHGGTIQSPVHDKLGLVLTELGELDGARETFLRALALDGQLASAHCNWGVNLLVNGDIEQAITCFKRCIECDPRVGLAWEKLAESGRFRVLEPGLLALLELQVNDTRLSEDQLKPLCFAFGKVLEIQGQHERAFRFFERANTIQRGRFRYDANQHHERIDQIIDVFSEQRIANGLPGANDSESPVFVVGMARSGSSLLGSWPRIRVCMVPASSSFSRSSNFAIVTAKVARMST